MLAVVALGGMLLLSGEREGAGFKTLTWQEFYRKMLARGEVSKLVVDADGEHVHVFLHDDAVIEGYNDGDGALLVRLPSFRLSIASVRAFEEHMQVRMGLGVWVGDREGESRWAGRKEQGEREGAGREEGVERRGLPLPCCLRGVLSCL